MKEKAMIKAMRLIVWSLSGLVISGSLHARDMSFDYNPNASAITIGSKNYSNGSVNQTDQTYYDGLGREAVFRGWNLPGVKLVSTGFKPYKNITDAKADFSKIASTAGSNIIRFPISWEGVNPAPNTMDVDYLQQQVAQIKAAIAQRMYILLDYHQDEYSRYFFNQNSWYTGNGAPKYVLTPDLVGTEYCGLICTSWGQNKLTNGVVRKGIWNFWHNMPTSAPGINTQDAFHSQLKFALQYIKDNLTESEFKYVIGLDPWNEPSDGGLPGDGIKGWENDYLWPFHQKVRTIMDQTGWQDKPSFAELSVFWNTNLGPLNPSFGGYNAKVPPGNRFVFNGHYYDVTRQIGLNGSKPVNGEYFADFDFIRNVSRFWGSAAFVSEFGSSMPGTGAAQDPNIVLNHQYAALSAGQQKNNGRYLAAYSPVLSGTQWNWNFYHNRNNEYMNFNPNKLMIAADGWNGEDFSAVDYATGSFKTNYDGFAVNRIYPRRASGQIMNFYDQNLAVDKSNNLINVAGILPLNNTTPYFDKSRFALLTWQGRSSSAPTEIFLPALYNPSDIAVITDTQIRTFDQVDAFAQNAPSSISLLRDATANLQQGGNRVLVWDDHQTQAPNTWHYALIVQKDASKDWLPHVLQQVQTELNQTITVQHQNPVYLLGAMKN